MTRRIFHIASPATQPTAGDPVRAGFAPSPGAAHLDALLRAFAFVAAIVWLTLPMAIAGRCSQPPRDFLKALAEPASQGRPSGGGWGPAVSSR
jgi:hypothetical protein